MTLASPVPAATTLRLGDDRYAVRPWLQGELADPRRWRTLESHGRWDVGSDAITGEWLSDSPSLFFDRQIATDFVWQVRVTRLKTDDAFAQRFRASKHAQGAEPENKYNFNFWLRVDVPSKCASSSGRSRLSDLHDPADTHGFAKPQAARSGDESFWSEYPARLGTGWNGMGDDYWSSLFQTVVWNPPGIDGNWTRLRRSPGYAAVRDVADVVPFMPYGEARRFSFAVSASRGLVRMYVDDQRVYEYRCAVQPLAASRDASNSGGRAKPQAAGDMPLPPAGYLGLCVWLCKVRFDQMRLYQWQ